MTFISKLFISLLALLFLVTGCQTTQQLTRIHGYTAAAAPIVDGELQDWTTPLAQAKDYSAFQYNLGHDKDNLYVGMRIADKGIQQRVMLYGVTVFIDTTAKRKEQIGIAYPLPFTEDQINKAAFEASQGGALDRNAFNQAYARMAQEFELLGFVEEDPKERIRVSNLASKDLKTAMGFDQLGAMSLEFKIPFAQIYDRALRYDEAITLAIQINAPEPNAEDEPGLFDDATNPILRGTQQNNPMMQGGTPGQINTQQPRMRRNPNSTIGTWSTIQLSPIEE